ncbi:MAG: hypothetical protein Q9226_003322 [Calogaya cf. arnoldii]
MAAATYETGSKRPWDAALAVDQQDFNANLDNNRRSIDNWAMSQADDARDIEQAKECIENCPNRITSDADAAWAFGSHLEDAPNPYLTLKSSGIVGMPLSSQAAERIRQEAVLRIALCYLLVFCNPTYSSCEIRPGTHT